VPRQRLLLVGSWIATTVIATIVSAAGVSLVTSDVTDDHRPAIRQADVIALLAAPVPTVATTAVPETTAPTTVAPPPTEPTVAAPTVPPPTAPPSTRPVPPPPTAPPLDGAEFATFESGGGTIVVGCLDDTIALASAWPNDGYQLIVDDAGPDAVRVLFAREDGEEDDIEADCARGHPVRTDGRQHWPGRDGDGDGGRGTGSGYGGYGGYGG
jgi:hypothetical protein